ncbi:MAG: right-handed parallel beta-helix repeat-containing protein, partial [Opitutaceae bacterium]
MRIHVSFSLLGVLLFSSTPPAASAATYYVSPTGSDSNPGTQALPFNTLQKGHDVAVAGDTIYMRGGMHSISSQVNFTRSGASGNPIKLWAYPGELPVLDASSITAEPTWVIHLNAASWWHIKGLDIQNNPHGGGIRLSDNSNHNIIENNKTHHNGRLSAWAATGIVLYGNPSNNLILNNDSHHNVDADFGDGDGFGAGITGSGNVLRGNRAWRNGDDGYDFFNTNNNAVGGILLVENNWAWENGFDDNLVKNPGVTGFGFKLAGIRPGTTGTSGGHTLKNNL